MQIRVVQIWGFLMTVLGWIFVACTMAMEGWKITSIGGMGGSAMINVAWYWSSLWRSCYTDSTAISNCYDYPVLWSVEGHIQIVRGLLMAALSLGMLGFVLSLMGMECTYIGGKDRSKYKKIYIGGWCHVTSGFLSTCGYAVYAQYVSVEYFNPDFDGLKYDLGTPLFLGWVGSTFHATGGFFYIWSVCKLLCGGDETVIIRPLPDPEQNKITSKTKVSTVSELSNIYSRSERMTKSGRTAKPGQSLKTARTTRTVGSAGLRSGPGSESGLSSRSSISTLSGSRSSGSSSGSQTVSTLSGSETKPFIKNSYI